MQRRYLFYVKEELPKPEAHLIQVVQCANGAANNGLSTWLAYPEWGNGAVAKPWRWIMPRPRAVSPSFAEFYNVQSQLQLLPLAQPWPVDRIPHKLTSSSTMVCKYYWPLFLKRCTSLVHTRDWNFVKAAIISGTPVVYECHHFLDRPYEPQIANSSLLQLAVTVVDTVKANMLENGMPEDKIAVIPNGYNCQFLERHLQAALEWRSRLLPSREDRLVVYAGALYPFKGIDLMLEAAERLPQVHFAIAGGPLEQQHHYQGQIQQRHLRNVKFLGFLGQQSLAALLQAADVLAHPHLSGRAASFTSPLKLFDYLAAGTPVVATKIASLRALQRENAIAAWCEPDDSREFQQALEAVLRRYPWRPQGYSQGPDYVRPFSWEGRIQRILSRVAPQFRPQPLPLQSQ